MELIDIIKWAGIIILVLWVLVYFRMKNRGDEPSVPKVTKRFGKGLIGFMSSDATDDTTGDFLKTQEQGKLKKKALNKIKDPCPYCKFNLKSGKDKCDECGKEFYPMAHTYTCKQCRLLIIVESLKDVEEQICPYCLTQNVIS